MNHEDLLRQTLRNKAGEASADLTFAEIRRNAVLRRRQAGRRKAALAAAAVVVAVGAPTAFLLRPSGDEPGPAPSPSPSPTVTEPTPTGSTSSDPEIRGLQEIARGRSIAIPWVSDGVIHVSDADDVPLPAGTWDSFTNYHGGWLLSGNGLVQLDGAGHVSEVSSTGSRIAVSADGMQTAFLADGSVRVGITSGMGEGENTIPVQSPDESGPIGFLSSGRVVYNGLKGQILVLDPSGSSSSVAGPGLWRASASTESGDLIAGTTVDDDGTAAVVSAATGKLLWTKARWIVGSFSPDGRYLAAYRSGTGGEFETVAILDARTGKVVATSNTRGIQALPAVPPTAWEDDDHLLIPYRGGSSWAIIRLSSEGEVSRASEVVESPPSVMPFALSARP